VIFFLSVVKYILWRSADLSVWQARQLWCCITKEHSLQCWCQWHSTRFRKYGNL